MKVVLLKDVKNIGSINQIVEVKDGYAFNYLIPNKLAVQFTENAKSVLDKQLNQQKEKAHELEEQANLIKNKIEKLNLEFSLKSNNGLTFGNISKKNIIDKLYDQYQIKVDKFMIELNEEHIQLGTHRIYIKLYKNVLACLTIHVIEEK